MRILLTQSDPRAAARIDEVLTDAGHEVVTCTESNGTPFPCRGVTGDECPLDAGAAVAVSAPGNIPPEPEAGDVGLICAMRRHVPLLVVAPDDLEWPGSPLGLVSLDDLPDEVDRAAKAPLTRLTEEVRSEVRRIVGDEGDATVLRAGSGLDVTVDVPAGTDQRTTELVAVRAQATVRRLDDWSSVVDVNVRVP